jgi:hypothetical protein
VTIFLLSFAQLIEYARQFSLFVFDFLQAMGIVLDVRWAHNGIVTTGHYCTAQGIIQQIGEVEWGTMARCSRRNEPNQWRDRELWRRMLNTHRVVVSTHDVLLNALRHGYVHLGADVGLLVFDEAHHAADKH